MTARSLLALVVTLSAPLTARAAHCIATCEFFSTHVEEDLSDPEQNVTRIEVVPVKLARYSELAKYRRELETSGSSIQDAFWGLQMRCLDTAAARSQEMFRDAPYAPRIIESLHLEEVTAEQVCIE